MAVAFAVAFIVTMIIYRDKPKDSSAAVPAAGSAAPAAENEILSPLAGTAIALSDVPDPTFAQGVLGQGAAVEPSDGKVYAPADAEVSTLFDTKHAIGLTLKNGAELLIHIGINTVDLNGEGFTAHVSDGDSVKQGDLLISFDKDFITKKGFKTVTPVIVTNPEDFDAVSMTASGKISALAPLLKLGV